ncbi:serine hydrolase domain-containing protein [Sphingomicrobium arenosum]|uniref:serine hydrolase domain-containing protein n=1 Tax=Sphingomicrobium arenosum TaxID=2233861 RepID=UPI00224101B2|nr:serine hydrolase domain-containing protein [Sphingomicrobium arenosum]
MLSILSAALISSAPIEPTPIDRAIEAIAPQRVVVGDEPPLRDIYEMMAELNVPAVSIALFDDNEIIAARSFGWADPAGRVPAHLDTRFQAASLSKSVAAYGVMALAEAGEVDLDQPVNARLEGWQLDEGEYAPATLRTLLSHRAGTSVPGFEGYADAAAMPDTLGVLKGEGNSPVVRIDKTPGDYSYSGGGYTVAQLLVEEAERQSFEDVMARMVLMPLGMDHSSFDMPPRGPRSTLALAHDENGRPIADGYHLYPETAAASLWTTPSDMARFLITMNRSLAGETGAPVSPEGARMLIAPPAEGANYALGFGIEGEGDALRFSHTGSNAGYKALMVSYPERGEGVVIMTNGDRGWTLFDALARAVGLEMGWPGYEQERLVRAEATPETLGAVAGGYKLGERIFRFSVDGDGLLLTDPEGETAPGILIEEDRLYLPESDQLVDIVRGEDGTVTGLSAGSTVLPKQ